MLYIYYLTPKPIFFLLRDKIKYIIKQLHYIDFDEFIIKKAHIHTLFLEKYIYYIYKHKYIYRFMVFSSSRCPLSEKKCIRHYVLKWNYMNIQIKLLCFSQKHVS